MKRIAMMVGLTVLGISSAAQKVPRTWSFDKDRVGEIASGFTNEVGAWKVVEDATAPSKPHVLAQTARNSGNTFNLVLVSGTSYKDVDLSVRMKAVAGSEDQGGGLVWRARDKQNYYVARFNPLEDNYRVYKVERGRRIQFASAEVKGDKSWHILRVVMKGDHIECYHDGKKHLDVREKTFSGTGKIGLWSKADAQSRFDDLTVSAL